MKKVIKCIVGSTKRLDIYFNGLSGEVFSKTSSYIVTAFNVNTPNVDVSAMKFKIATYYGDKIFENSKFYWKFL